MGLAPSGQHENTANLLYAEVPVPVYSHRLSGAGESICQLVSAESLRPLN
jgi:hypothetical protein